MLRKKGAFVVDKGYGLTMYTKNRALPVFRFAQSLYYAKKRYRVERSEVTLAPSLDVDDQTLVAPFLQKELPNIDSEAPSLNKKAALCRTALSLCLDYYALSLFFPPAVLESIYPAF